MKNCLKTLLEHNQSVEPAGGSRLGHFQLPNQWRLPPAAHAHRSTTKPMQALFCTLSITAILATGCGRPASAGDTSASTAPLSIYVMSDVRIEGGRFIDTPDFPKLGYIGAAAALVITRLEAVAPVLSREQDAMVDKDGKRTVFPVKQLPALSITMRAEDAKKFATITQEAVGKRLLLMLGDTPLIAPTVRAPISTPSLTLTLGEKTDDKRVENDLKKLVR
jgi:hypothetical protein